MINVSIVTDYLANMADYLTYPLSPKFIKLKKK